MTTRNLVMAALMIALTTVLGMLKISFPFFNEISITGQTLGVMLAGALLGARLGGLSMGAFVILVAVGAPLLSGFTGGIGVFATARGGWVLSWPIAAYAIGYLVERNYYTLRTWKAFLITLFGGIIVIYAIGMPYQAALTNIPLSVVMVKSLMFIPGDLIKAFVAAYLAVRMRNIYPLIKPTTLQENKAA
ncbi:biotin transporter BioY [Brevibacillus ginsengisoli]|uniref:biotin transporter BioY n=1 Tax=Brevibacillus ginsengisoli TaxID=363854 RepID=UPI003CF14ED0